MSVVRVSTLSAVALAVFVYSPRAALALENGLTDPCTSQQLEILRMNENIVEHGMRSMIRAYDYETPHVRSVMGLYVDVDAHPSRFEQIRDDSEHFDIGTVHCKHDDEIFCRDGFQAVTVLDVHFCDGYWSQTSMTRQSSIMFHERTHDEYDTRDLFYDASCSTQFGVWDPRARTENFINVRLNRESRVTGVCESGGLLYSVKMGLHGGIPPLGAPKGCTELWSQNGYFCGNHVEHDNAATWQATWYAAFVTELQTLYGGNGWMGRPMYEPEYFEEETLIASGRDVYDEITCSWTYMSDEERRRTDYDVFFRESAFEAIRYYEFLFGPDHWSCDGIGVLQQSLDAAAFRYSITEVAAAQMPPGSDALTQWLRERDAALMATMF